MRWESAPVNCAECDEESSGNKSVEEVPYEALQRMQLALSVEIESAVASVRAALNALDGAVTRDDLAIWDELGRLCDVARELRALSQSTTAETE